MISSLRMLIGALLTAPVFIVVAISFVLGVQPGALTPSVLGAAPIVLGAAVNSVVELVGYRLVPIAPGSARGDAEQASTERYRTATILRFALCEAVLIVSLAAGFVVPEGGFLVVLVGAVVSVVLIGLHCWPWERPVARSQAALERDGGESFLREGLGLPPATGGGAIRRL